MYQYLTKKCNIDVSSSRLMILDDDEIFKDINRFGEDGWMLVNTITTPALDDKYVVLMRVNPDIVKEKHRFLKEGDK